MGLGPGSGLGSRPDLGPVPGLRPVSGRGPSLDKRLGKGRGRIWGWVLCRGLGLDLGLGLCLEPGLQPGLQPSQGLGRTWVRGRV